MTLQTILSGIQNKRSVTPEDCLAIRRAIFQDMHISQNEADVLFLVNDLVTDKCHEWSDVFMEAITQFVVRQAQPFGYVDEKTALWLITNISRDGRVEGMTELRTLLHVVKMAEHIPDNLVRFTLETVEVAVLLGDGVVGRSRTLSPGIIGEAEVELLRTVLYAIGGSGGTSISKLEAEFMFDLADACDGVDNHKSFSTLFTGAIANYLMALAVPATMPRTEVIRRDNWLATKTSLSQSVKNLWSGSPEVQGSSISQRLFGAITQSNDQKSYIQDDAALTDAEQIAEGEADWLVARLRRDGKLSRLERDLIAFLKEECPNVHDTLLPKLKAA